MKNIKIFVAILILVVLSLAFTAKIYHQNQKPAADLFKAPGKDFQSSKKVEDYFVEKLRMSSDEAKNIRSQGQGNDGKVSLRLSDNTNLDALISNLHYYGFIRDEKAFRYALENTKDTVQGKSNAIKVDKTRTIDVGAYYKISENMDAWQLADNLLNKPTYIAYDEYGYLFMP